MSGTRVSIVYVTQRSEPRFEWFADGLSRGLEDDELEVIMVDGLHSAERGARFEQIVGGRFPFRHVRAKPSPFCGPHRLTRRDWAAPASARNTGVVYASHPYVVFVDDLSVPGPAWWSAARDAAAHRYVAAGAYAKHLELEVADGVVVSSRPTAEGVDSRSQIQPDARLARVGGGALYGCSFGAPKSLLLELNGLDELCDSIMGEDSQLGFRIEHAGIPIYYDRRMFTIESEELHHQGEPPARLEAVIHPALYMARLREFGPRRRSVPGRCDTTHLLFDIVHGTRATESLGNYYRLADLTPDSLESLRDAFPRHHWFDQRPLAEM